MKKMFVKLIKISVNIEVDLWLLISGHVHNEWKNIPAIDYTEHKIPYK